MHIADHHSVAELKYFAKQQKKAQMLRRLQVVILAAQGQTTPQIVEATDVSRRTIQDWIRRYNADGVDGLKDRRRGGNRRHLTDEQENLIRRHIDNAADDPNDGVRRGEDLRCWIEEQFGVVYSLNGVYELLHRIGYSCLMPRPRHPKVDPEAQEAFKKTLWIKSPLSPKNTRKNASKSGFRTKPGLVNKAR